MQMASCGWKSGRRRPSIDDYGYQYKAVMSGKPSPKRWLSLQWKQPHVIFLFTGIVLVITLLYFFIFKFLGEQSCLPAPYLYLTGHNGENIYKYSRDGCHLESRVIWYGSVRPYQLRGMVSGKYLDHDVIFAAQVSDSNDVYDVSHTPSNIIIVGPCSGWSRTRPFIAAINAGRYGAYHAYSVAIDQHGDLYASFQHTDGIVRFSTASLEPLPFPETITNLGQNNNHYINQFKAKYLLNLPNGTFAQFGNPGIHNQTAQGIRSIAWVPVNFTVSLSETQADTRVSRNLVSEQPQVYSKSGDASPSTGFSARGENPHSKKEISPINLVPEYLWIANEDYNRVFIIDKDAREMGWIKVQSPVGMIYDSTRGIVFVGSKSKKMVGGGAVYGIDINTWSVVKTFSLLGKVGLMHPTGLLVYEDILYVAEQTSNLVVAFNITTQRFIRNVITSFPDDVEQITLSNC